MGSLELIPRTEIQRILAERDAARAELAAANRVMTDCNAAMERAWERIATLEAALRTLLAVVDATHPMPTAGAVLHAYAVLVASAVDRESKP